MKTLSNASELDLTKIDQTGSDRTRQNWTGLN